MNTTTHKCAALGCDRIVQAAMLMCRTDWASVTPSTKNEVYAAYRERGNRPDAPLTPRYNAAVIRAVEEAAQWRQRHQAVGR